MPHFPDMIPIHSDPSFHDHTIHHHDIKSLINNHLEPLTPINPLEPLTPIYHNPYPPNYPNLMNVSHGTSHLGASHSNHGDNVNGSIGVNDDNGNHAGIHGDTDLHGHSHGGIDYTHNDANGSISVSADTDFHGGNNVSASIGYNW